jgi:hypothetical protein
VILTLQKIWIAVQEWKDSSYYPENVSERSIAAVTDTFSRKVQTFCETQPSGWMAFSLAVHEYGHWPLHFVNPYPQPSIVPNTPLLPFDATLTDRTYAELSTLQRRMLLDILEDSSEQMPARSWAQVVHLKTNQATPDLQAEQNEVERLISLPIFVTGDQLPSTSVSKAWTSKGPTSLLQKGLPSTDHCHIVQAALRQQLTHHKEIARGREESAIVSSFSHLADRTESTAKVVEQFAAATHLLQGATDASLQAVPDSTRLAIEMGKQRIQLLRANLNLLQELSEQLSDD